MEPSAANEEPFGFCGLFARAILSWALSALLHRAESSLYLKKPLCLAYSVDATARGWNKGKMGEISAESSGLTLAGCEISDFRPGFNAVLTNGG